MAKEDIGLTIKHNLDKARESVKGLNKDINSTYTELQGVKKETNGVKDAFKSLGNIAKSSGLIGWIGTVKSGLETLTKWSNKQAEYIESLNFLDQAYNNTADSGLRLLDTIEKTVGYDPANLTQSLAMFRQLGNALEMDDKVASMLAENLLKLSIDTKSITGASLDKVTSKYMSAMAGNTRAVRSYGIDVTQAGLQQQALNLGIEKSVSDMSRAEKSILMYITMARQMSSANGDLSKTVNSVANQYEIFKNQISETGRLLGGFLIPILKTVLPLVNGVLMAINTLVNAVLSLFGIDASSFADEFGTVAVDIDDVASGFDDIGTSATKAGKAAQEAQKSLRGFDKLNVIKTPTSSSGSGGGGVSSGGGVGKLGAIDSQLLSKLSEYDLHLDSINNTATKIRDNIMEWLGFTKEINPLTGEISWKYEGIGKTLSNIFGGLFSGDLTKTAASITTILLLSKSISTLFASTKKLIDFLSKTKIGSVILKPTIDLFKKAYQGAKLYNAMNLSTLSGIGAGIDTWKEEAGAIGRVSTALMGAGGLYLGFNMVKGAMESIQKEGVNLNNFLQATSGLLTNVASSAMIGASMFGALGAAGGAAIGSLISLIESLTVESKDYVDYFIEDGTKKFEEFTESLNSQFKAIEDSARQEMTKNKISEQLVSELDKIVDANGKVKQGYEDRASFIINELNKAYGLEIKMIDGVIIDYGKQIDSLKEIIKQRKAQIYLNLAEEQYTAAIKNQAQALGELKRIDQEIQLVKMDSNKSDKEKAKLLEELSEKYQKAEKNLELIEEAKANYTNLSTAILKDDAKQIEYYTEQVDSYFKKLDEVTNESNENMYKTSYNTYRDMATEATASFEARIKVAKKSYEEMDEVEKAYAAESLNNIVNTTKAQLQNANDVLTPGMITAWQTMGEQSEDALLAALSMLPKDVRQNVVNQMYPEGKEMSTKLQQGINSLGITITPKVLSPTQQALKNVANNISNSLSSTITLALGLKTKANGGLYSSGVWRPMKAYANGGFPSHGELFMAREKGPELVGKIGNSTAVMNNDQILDQMTIAVARGMSAVDRDTNVNIIAQGDAEGMLDFIKFKQISKNRQYGL